MAKCEDTMASYERQLTEEENLRHHMTQPLVTRRVFSNEAPFIYCLIFCICQIFHAKVSKDMAYSWHCNVDITFKQDKNIFSSRRLEHVACNQPTVFVLISNTSTKSNTNAVTVKSQSVDKNLCQGGLITALIQFKTPIGT